MSLDDLLHIASFLGPFLLGAIALAVAWGVFRTKLEHMGGRMKSIEDDMKCLPTFSGKVQEHDKRLVDLEADLKVVNQLASNVGVLTERIAGLQAIHENSSREIRHDIQDLKTGQIALTNLTMNNRTRLLE